MEVTVTNLFAHLLIKHPVQHNVQEARSFLFYIKYEDVLRVLSELDAQAASRRDRTT